MAQDIWLILIHLANAHILPEGTAGGIWTCLARVGHRMVRVPSNKRHLEALIAGDAWDTIRQPGQLGIGNPQFRVETPIFMVWALCILRPFW